MSPAIVELAAALPIKPTLLITVDNGISSIAGVARAHELGMQVLVTDHHLPGTELPAATVTVNPNLSHDTFASKALAGCGVAWYVACALAEVLTKKGIEPITDFTVDSLLPLVALGTVADVVALDQNNRELVSRGMALIREGKSQPGLSALALVAGRSIQYLAVADFGFAIGPRLNAAGRMDTMDAGIECLLTDNPEVAQTHAMALDVINKARRETQAEVVTGALTDMDTAIAEGQYSIVVFRPDWHEGVIGIAAGQLKEKAWRPTFVFTQGDDGTIKGSGRSIPGFHLRDAMALVDARVPGLMQKFGGHAMAAGATLREGGFAEFKQQFEKVAQEMLTPALLAQVIEHDGSLPMQCCTTDVAEMLNGAVWGQAFPEPTFMDTFIVKEAKKMGKEQNHLRLTLTRQGQDIEAVQFFVETAPPETGSSIRALYKLDVNRFKSPTVQLRVDRLFNN
jgi:single-stranded-DNA-specific exonuclease